jgi:hypothetical protein
VLATAILRRTGLARAVPRRTRLAKKRVSVDATPVAVPTKAMRRRILRTLLAAMTTSAERKAKLVRQCGKRHRAAFRGAGEAKVYRVARAANRMNVGTSAEVAAANAKVRTAIRRPMAASRAAHPCPRAIDPRVASRAGHLGLRAIDPHVASRAGHLGLRAIAKGGAEVGAVLHLQKRLMTKLRSNQPMKLHRTNSLLAMLITNSRAASPDRGNVPINDTVANPVADAQIVRTPVNDFRKSFRVPVLARVVKSKSGFALDESLSMARRLFSESASGRRIMCASMDA